MNYLNLSPSNEKELERIIDIFDTALGTSRRDDLNIELNHCIHMRGDSMSPTLLDGDKLLISIIEPGNQTGDIGIYYLPKHGFIVGRVKEVEELKDKQGNILGEPVVLGFDNQEYLSYDCRLENGTALGKVVGVERLFKD